MRGPPGGAHATQCSPSLIPETALEPRDGRHVLYKTDVPVFFDLSISLYIKNCICDETDIF